MPFCRGRETGTHIYSSMISYETSRSYLSIQFYLRHLLFCALSLTPHEKVCLLILETPRRCNSRSNSNNAGSYLSADTSAAEGTTPFHWAAWGAHLSTCQLLLSRGADHRRVNAYGCNAAHWCGLSGDVDVCRYYRASAGPWFPGRAGYRAKFAALYYFVEKVDKKNASSKWEMGRDKGSFRMSCIATIMSIVFQRFKDIYRCKRKFSVVFVYTRHVLNEYRLVEFLSPFSFTEHASMEGGLREALKTGAPAASTGPRPTLKGTQSATKRPSKVTRVC